MLLSTLWQIDPNTTMGYLVLGYVVMWGIAFLYVLNLAVKQRNLRRDITLMRRLLEEDEG